jgi:uncharacterized protein (TIGR04255 family)
LTASGLLQSGNYSDHRIPLSELEGGDRGNFGTGHQDRVEVGPSALVRKALSASEKNLATVTCMGTLVADQITFGKPPVNEVVLGRHFLQRPDFVAPYFGTFWSKIRERFPKVEQTQPVFSPQEIVFLDPGNVQPRVWYVSADQAMLVQLQQNRFYYNWRQRPAGVQYGRFPALLSESLEIWEVLNEVAVELTGRPFQTTGGEITYVNFIEIKDASPTEIAQQSLCDFFWNKNERFLPPPSGFSRMLNFPLPEAKGVLDVQLGIAKNVQTGNDAIRLELNAHATLVEGESYEDWINVAHDFLVAAFKDLTSSQMHKSWELQE